MRELQLNSLRHIPATLLRSTRVLAAALLIGLFVHAHSDAQTVPKVEPLTLGETVNVSQCGNIIMAGQVCLEDIRLLKRHQIKRVINLRKDGEIDWDEEREVESLGIEYFSLPYDDVSELSDELFDRFRELIKADDSTTLVHCGSANRVASLWVPYRVLDQGIELEEALAEAKQVGLRKPEYAARAVEYIQERRQDDESQGHTEPKKSVRPGINDDFLDPKLQVDQYINRFEVESREIYTSRFEILKACGIKSGDRVADIGAGTGLFTRIFSAAVAPSGWVYAVEISPRFVEHINQEAVKYGLKNLSPVLCQEDSVNLPPGSVDVVFICDTYHHFEYPEATMKSIHRALKDTGYVCIIDFERIPGKSREWVLNHVRAGKQEVIKELESFGFELIEEVKVGGLVENYFLRLKRKSETDSAQDRN
ncbi:MAG TPA: methyltransferase domain-containing protein [Pirellulaceae bacterium]|nr:methyltransferase domain-containing protein [Pirellulaceae bacterium]HMO93622.1 methyltransferase domain-containing protein [Pirellulaceae bacterium]HMP70494.1 methyltransferase domain-containing protein [Pirellulaceae bacterium]